MSKKKVEEDEEKYVGFDETKDIEPELDKPEPEPEFDGYDFQWHGSEFVVIVTKGDREYKVCRPAKEIKNARNKLTKMAQYGLRMRWI